MKNYDSLFKQHKTQVLDRVFAHFYAINGDYDEPFRIVAKSTSDGINAWEFSQPRFKLKYPTGGVQKLKNYLNYTFVRLVELEQLENGKHFVHSADGNWVTFNTGLQNQHGADLLATFQKYTQKIGALTKIFPDWVFKGCYTSTEINYRNHFGISSPSIAWYSNDSRDYIFDISYDLQTEVFEHIFDRAKERAGLPGCSDEVVRNYLRGAMENIIPKIRRNYKVAIPVYYVEEKRMQILLPFMPANNESGVSCFLVERDDINKIYRIKTIFDLDHAYFSARLITRPDKDWLNP